MSYQHCNGQHDLAAILRRSMGDPGHEEVVRWCRNCGAVSIDVDVDGRAHPGAHLAMQFPRIAEAHVSGVPEADHG